MGLHGDGQEARCRLAPRLLSVSSRVVGPGADPRCRCGRRPDPERHRPGDVPVVAGLERSAVLGGARPADLQERRPGPHPEERGVGVVRQQRVHGGDGGADPDAEPVLQGRGHRRLPARDRPDDRGDPRRVGGALEHDVDAVQGAHPRDVQDGLVGRGVEQPPLAHRGGALLDRHHPTTRLVSPGPSQLTERLERAGVVAERRGPDTPTGPRTRRQHLPVAEQTEGIPHGAARHPVVGGQVVLARQEPGGVELTAEHPVGEVLGEVPEQWSHPVILPRPSSTCPGASEFWWQPP
ncbi:hypothetical protein CURTO8I2_100019 [Curtobacterium sp. 8I-2]|nr:hypothetical protein CURTO8I2_100019 [Curtobacterium sp. 8I-2]